MQFLQLTNFLKTSWSHVLFILFVNAIAEAEGGYDMVGVVADVLPSALFLLQH